MSKVTIFIPFMKREGLIFRLADTSDLFETLPECRSLESSIMTYNCNFKGNGLFGVLYISTKLRFILKAKYKCLNSVKDSNT